MNPAEPDRNDQPEAQNGQEPLTVLDWFKSLFSGDPIPLPQAEEQEPEPFIRSPQPPTGAERDEGQPSEPLEWGEGWLSAAALRLPAGLILALAAQYGLAQRTGSSLANVIVYLLGAALVLWALLAGDVRLPAAREPRHDQELAERVRARPLLLGVAFALLTYLTAYDNQFRLVTVISWLLALVLTFAGLWTGEPPWADWRQRFRAWVNSPTLNINISGWHLLLLVSLGVAAYFRFAELAEVPFEMWSDQAEKLLDVRDVLEGDHKIFFQRNSGREAVEFYLAAFTATVFGTGLSFMTLKLVTASAGFVALIFIYLLAKELGGRETGLYSLLLAGAAFWPNIAARAGLRMPLNELAVAPAMFFLVRGLRQRRRNDLLWAGLAVGLGLQGYTGARVLPFVIVLGVLWALLHLDDRRRRMRVLIALGCLVLVSFVAFVPLLRVLVDQPDWVLYRTLTRVGELEQSLQRPVLLQFGINMWDILRMFAWNTGEIWIVTVPNRPVLDWVTGALFHLGLLAVAFDYVRRRRWESLFLLTSLPVLLLPSALALAFPNENPAPNRVTGAVVPVFIIAGFALATVAGWIRQRLANRRRRLALVPIILLLLIAGSINHRLVFETYAQHQRRSAWNNSEAGEVMRGFEDSIGHFEDIYFVAFPFWMDSRLAALEAGAPLRDYSIPPERLPELELDPSRHHLFLLKPEDIASITRLQSRYPNGVLKRYDSAVDGRDFFTYLVPGVSDPVGEPQQ